MKMRGSTPLQLIVVSCALLPLTSALGAFLSTETQSGRPRPQADLASNATSSRVEPLRVEPVVILKEDMILSHGAAMCLAVAWIGLIGAAPILIHVLESRKDGITKAMIGLSITMWLALFGGLYAFTNIVAFQSPHFTKVRSLNMIECIYFMSQVITTVGYGDITPANREGQVFVAIYAIFAIVVIAELMAQMMRLVTEAVNHRDEKDEPSQLSPIAYLTRPSMLPLLKSVVVFLAVVSIWIMFFHFHTGEEKTWLEAIYMAVITMSTIGFGAITPVTQEGMIFSSFMMIFGAGSLAKMVMEFSLFCLELSIWERWDPNWLRTHLKDHSYFGWQELPDNESKMTEAQFISYMLLENRLATKKQLESVAEAFKQMTPRKGAVPLSSIHQMTGLTPRSVDSKVKGDADAHESVVEPEWTQQN